MRDLTNKVVYITGASGGMGTEVVRLLVKSDVKLALFSNDAPALEKLKELVIQAPGKKDSVYAETIDVSSEGDVSGAFMRAAEALGTPEILINLAGLSIPAKIYDMSVEDYDKTIDVNLKGTFLSAKHFSRLCSIENGGQIINMGSMAAKRANANAPMYCTAKAAVNMLSSGIAMQVKEKSIRVTTINPGGTDTQFWGNRPVKRENLLKPSDIAELIMFILTRESYVVYSEVNLESFNNM